jgi:hypothetical protein
MPDTNITLAPASAHASGGVVVTASASLFTADDVGRAIAILHRCDTVRLPGTAYLGGRTFISEYNQVARLYRVLKAGTTAAANLAGTTPDYDLAAPNEPGPGVQDGSAVLKYLGPGRHAWGFGVISAYTSATQVTVTVDPRGPFVGTHASLRWRLGEFSAVRGWPIAGTFHKGRLWLGGSPTRPQTLWASQAADFENFAPSEADGTVLDTNAIAVSLDADEVERIRWLSSGARGLIIGTASGEWLLSAANRNAAISPANITADRAGDRGTDADGQVQRVGGIVLFPQRGGRRLREMQYDFASDRFVSSDLCALADDIAGPGFIDAAYADVPDGMWFGLRADGRVACLTYDTEQKLRAWTIDTLGGGGVAESICAVPDPDGTGSDLYLSVLRTVAGVERRTIEVIRSPFRGEVDAREGGFFVDCGLSYSGAPVNTVTGLAHLEGQVVAICADGSARDRQTVTDGQVSVSGTEARTIHVGLPYRSRIIDLPPASETQRGTIQGLPQRTVKATLRLLDTGAATVGGKGETGQALVFRRADDLLGTAVPLFTGDLDVLPPGGWGRGGQVQIETDEPLPLTVLAVIKTLEVGDA